MTIGERIKMAREKNGIAQTDLAIKIGVSKQTLFKYENGIVTNIPSDKIEEIAKITHVSPAYIMGWEDNLNNADTDIIADIYSDMNMLESVKKLISLSKEHKQTIYDNIDYLYEKEVH